MYLRDNEGKYLFAERFIRTLTNRIYKYTTSVLKNAYIDTLDDTVNKYNNLYYSTIKMIVWTLIQKIIREILNLKLVIM